MYNKYYHIITNSISKLTLSQKVLILLVLLLSVYKLLFAFYENPFCYDNLGYYLYLPKFFIYHDPYMIKLNDWLYPLIEKYNNTPYLYQLNFVENHYVIRYPLGQSLFYAPFFFLAHIITQFTSYPADGFSIIYQVTVRLGSFFYLIAGLFLLRKALTIIFDEKTTSINLILLVFGTNLHLYAGSTSPHETLFLLYSGMLYLTIHRKNYFSLHFWLKAAAITGLACITRPTDVIIGFIPLLWGLKNLHELGQHLWSFITKNTITLLLSLLVFCAVLFLQLLYWKIFAGKWVYYTYEATSEKLQLLSPHTLEFLFSYRKGWFIYTPLMFVALFGFRIMYRQRRDLFLSLFVFYVINLYLISSWSTWWYADSFSQRTMVQSLAVSIIPLGFLLRYIMQKRVLAKSLFFTLIMLLFSLNLFQTWQFHNGIFPLDRLTKDAYFYIFLKTKIDIKKRESLMLINRNIDESYIPDIEHYTERIIALWDYDNVHEGDMVFCLSDTVAHSGMYSYKMDTIHQFSNVVSAKFFQLTDKSYVWVKASAWVYLPYAFKENPFSFVITFQYKKEDYHYKMAPIDEKSLHAKQWNYVEFFYLTPEVLSSKDRLLVYFWLRGTNPVWIDDFRVDIYEPV